MIIAMMGTGELLLILAVALLLFGGKRLPELAKSLGQGVREFKKACNGLEDEEILEVQPEKEKLQNNLKDE